MEDRKVIGKKCQSGPIALLSCHVMSQNQIVTQVGRPLYPRLWGSCFLSERLCYLNKSESARWEVLLSSYAIAQLSLVALAWDWGVGQIICFQSWRVSMMSWLWPQFIAQVRFVVSSSPYWTWRLLSTVIKTERLIIFLNLIKQQPNVYLF